MADEHKPTSLEDLDARVTAARAAHRQRSGEGGSAPGGKPPMSGFGLAMRIGTELVAAIAVGVGVGYVLDMWLGSKPWLMVVFFFLGSAAGMLNVFRATASMGQRDGSDGA
ncbi:MAG: AtpZ/AtpI family protein [Alphaproteobacteria bacterium]|nr:AtpZ/AtpI family protein [Alphaproteobacteria bacterium]